MPALGVDAGRGLVEEGHLGSTDQGQGQGQALLLATREVAARGGGHVAAGPPVQQLVGGDGVLVVAGEEVEDPARAEHRVDPAALEHDADAAGQRAVVAPRVEPEHAAPAPATGRR